MDQLNSFNKYNSNNSFKKIIENNEPSENFKHYFSLYSEEDCSNLLKSNFMEKVKQF